MKKKDRSRVWWWLALFFVACIALVVGYFLGFKKGRDLQRVGGSPKIMLKEKKAPPPPPPPQAMEEKVLPDEKETIVVREIEKPKPVRPKESCKQIEEDVRGFFHYLDKKDYVHQIENGIKTYDHFKKLIRILSDHPPVPAGEGMDPEIMTRNIYHFFRLLEKKDLRLLRAVMRNEADTMEINMDLFFKWFMVGSRCPDPGGIRPSLDTMFQYAGFFLNTIGGRSYLFRRPLKFRILMNYYCLLIIHEADKQGKNRDGIDIFPQIEPLATEIGSYPDLSFQNEYLQRLNGISKYYLEKR